MTENPLFNALAAAAYIVLVVSFMTMAEGLQPVESVLLPMAFLSLFVLSAAVMAYLFLYEPMRLFFAGQHQKALTLFLQTVAIFAAITLSLLAYVFFLAA